MKKLAIVTTHPIQYYAPWFRLLSHHNYLDVKVFYTWSQSKVSVKDKVFGKEVSWDIPLLEGYDYEFIENISKRPGSHHYRGIICPGLVPAIQCYCPDVILVFGWNFVSHFKTMRFFKNKMPVWFRGDSTLIDENGGYKQILRRIFLSFVYKYIDKALYVGKANKAYFLKHGVRAEKLKLVPHAVDNGRFGGKDIALNKDAVKWRLKLGYSPMDIVILFAGKFEDKKQPDLLVKAFKLANLTRNNPLKLLLLGDGPLKWKLVELVDNDPNITFMPFTNQSKMPLVYRICDFMCLPSKGPGETWGLAVNESMASGRPVIVSNKVGCAEDLVNHTINGYIFDYNKIYELKNILVNLNKNDSSRLGKRAKSDIQLWSYSKQTETLIELMKEEGNTLK